MRRTAKFLAAGVTTIALAGGIGAGIASADPSSPAPTPSATASATPGTPQAKHQQAKDKQAGDKQAKAGRKHGLLARALHGEATLGGKKARVVDFQKGAVTAASATEVTVKSKDGFTATYAVSAKTKVRKDKLAAAIADVLAGDRVRVVATKDGSALTATTIADHGTK